MCNWPSPLPFHSRSRYCWCVLRGFQGACLSACEVQGFALLSPDQWDAIFLRARCQHPLEAAGRATGQSLSRSRLCLYFLQREENRSDADILWYFDTRIWCAYKILMYFVCLYPGWSFIILSRSLIQSPRHGINALPPEQQSSKGRISIISLLFWFSLKLIGSFSQESRHQVQSSRLK